MQRRVRVSGAATGINMEPNDKDKSNGMEIHLRGLLANSRACKV